MTSKAIRMLVGVGMAVVALVTTAFAADSDYPHKKGDIIVYFKNKGTTSNQAQQFASRFGMNFRRALRTPGIYLITIPGADGFSEAEEKVRVQQKLDAIRRESAVKYAVLNQRVDKHQIPNDPVFGTGPFEHWNLWQMNLPDATGAWSYTLGNPGIIVADLDDGFDTLHPDFLDAFSNSRIVAPYDASDGKEDANTGVGRGDPQHGLMTSGVIAAGTDNGIAVSGVTWEGVKLMPVKVADDAGALWFELIFDGYQHVIDYNNNPLNTRKVAVQSMSYGAGGYDPISDELLQMEADQGVILCASAGNSRPFAPAGYPASLSQVISVAATINGPPLGVVTSYSSAGTANGVRKVDLAAPSSDVFGLGSFSVPLLAGSGGGLFAEYWWTGVFPFNFDGGTSYSCPEVAGAVALMLSLGFPSGEVFDALKTTAIVGPGDPKPNLDTGWGEVDVAAAMALAVPGVLAQAPIEGTKFQYQTIPFKFRTHFMASINSVTIELTGGSGPIVVPPADYTITPDPDNGFIIFVEGTARLKDPVDGTDGEWTISCNCTGLDANPYVDTAVVTAQQRVLLAGTSMFSVPFQLDGTDFPAGRLPEELFDPGFRQFRWLPTIDGLGNPTGSYSEYITGSGNSDDAGFTPASADIIKRTQIGDVPVDTPQNGPYGVGLWVITDTDTTFDFERGPEDGVKYYRLKLKRGWNMIGNPYEFIVDWNSCSILELPSQRLLEMAQAVSEKIIRPQIFRYEILLDGSKGYTWESVPRGQLRPIDAHWVYAEEDCYLQVPPLPGAEIPSRNDSRVRGEGWLVQIGARTDNSMDSANFFGATKNFNEKFDRVGDPPASPNGVQVWFESANGNLAQDMREFSSGRETFTLKVRPTKANSRVTLNWNDVVPSSKRMRVVLKDEATGKTVVMRQSGSYGFTSDDSLSTRTFTVIAAPEIGGRLAVGAVRVAGGGRGNATYSIEYSLTADANVAVRILSQTGKPVADLEARSRTAGPNSVTWNARDSKGRSVAPGVYMVQITAEAANGERVRRSTPITVIR